MARQEFTNNQQELDQYKDTYREQISVFETLYGINLSTSKNIDITHVQYVRNLGHQVVEVLLNDAYILEDEASNIHSRVDNSLVLTENDRRTLLMADVQSQREWLKYAWDTDLEKYGPQAVEPYRDLYEEQIRQLNSTEEWYLLPASNSPANKFGLDINGETVYLATFTDWTDDSIYANHPLEVVIIEEMLHLSADTQQLIGEDLSSDERITVEESGVIFYVAELSKKIGIPVTTVQKFLDNSDRLEELKRWERLIGEIGEDNARKIFFQGSISERAEFVYEQIRRYILDEFQVYEN